ncbi:dTMP kinase [Methyloligella sp. 2.7D]|uniref:dTMP kinase n=1 Tax=unclassified Methyloligella TaxID=2625955 RepID=UPI00157BED8B|nr:dTMP kinase [Methyloligella sp. GL2]QKP77446.1 dTMP kinase [Methyloligella sp. GL2]
MVRYDPGKLITLEGGEGSGKSTQAEILATRLARAGRRILATREPGGSPGAEAIRDALLQGEVWRYGPFAEALLFSIARKDHIDYSIAKAVTDGRWVVCDRFMDSTRAYQGEMGGVKPEILHALERVTMGEFTPDLTLILDIPAEQGLARAHARREESEEPDRFEREEVRMHDRIRQAFLDIAEEEPERCVVIDASQSEATVSEDIWEAVSERLGP